MAAINDSNNPSKVSGKELQVIDAKESRANGSERMIRSVELAEMSGIEHKNLLRMIDTFLESLGESEKSISSCEPISYTDDMNRTQRAYLLSEKLAFDLLMDSDSPGAKKVMKMIHDRITQQKLALENQLQKTTLLLENVSVKKIKRKRKTVRNSKGQKIPIEDATAIDKYNDKGGSKWRQFEGMFVAMVNYVRNSPDPIATAQYVRLYGHDRSQPAFAGFAGLLEAIAERYEDIPFAATRSNTLSRRIQENLRGPVFDDILEGWKEFVSPELIDRCFREDELYLAEKTKNSKKK